MKSASKAAFSMVEVVLACALMSILMVVLGTALSQAQGAFRNASGTSDAADELRKCCSYLRQELIQTSATQVSSSNSTSSLGSPDGAAIWFLSNRGADGNAQFLDDGSPFWQRNVLYYLVVPNNHAALFGWNCPGGAGPGPFARDDRCPHKVLIRKEIDSGPATDTSNPANIEALMSAADIVPYLTRPAGYSVVAMNAEPGVDNTRIVGRNLLTFDVTTTAAGLIGIDTRAVSIARARTKISLGSVSLFDSPYTFHFGMSVSPSVP